MRSKWQLFVGIILLITGIILKKTTDIPFLPVLLIILGVVLKAIYIIKMVNSGFYKLGFELFLLGLGLVLFLSGLYFKVHPTTFSHYYLLFSGICLKFLFIIFFIKKIRTSRKSTELTA